MDTAKQIKLIVQQNGRYVACLDIKKAKKIVETLNKNDYGTKLISRFDDREIWLVTGEKWILNQPGCWDCLENSAIREAGLRVGTSGILH